MIGVSFGHEGTSAAHRCVEADISTRRRCLPCTQRRPPSGKLVRFRASDSRMQILRTLKLCVERAVPSRPAPVGPASLATRRLPLVEIYA